MIERYLGRYSEYVYALLRIVAGFVFLLHGTQKLFGFPPSARPMELNAMMTVAGVIEIVAGLMILLGFLAGLAAFIASGEMAVAYFMVHQPIGALPLTNNGEPAVLLCFIFLYIAARGSGLLSVDSLLGRGGLAI
ncbi:MAG: DoxX family protein [Pyrinomonadaceae bacterium]